MAWHLELPTRRAAILGGATASLVRHGAVVGDGHGGTGLRRAHSNEKAAHVDTAGMFVIIMFVLATSLYTIMYHRGGSSVTTSRRKENPRTRLTLFASLPSARGTRTWRRALMVGHSVGFRRLRAF